jgi:DNA-binding winged helix-turn-helix (wHTH) protein
VFVRKLRQKLERVSPSWRYIHTHFGIGYRFAAELTAAGGSEIRPVPATEILESERSDEFDLARA